jgi:DNA polymerase
MDIVTIDFETYYDREYSLSKMTTEAYIRDPRFEVIGVCVKVNDFATDWYSGDNVGKFLNSLDYSDKAILAHNTAFDGAILSWHYGIKPKFWFDTMSMARPLHNATVGGSLKALVSHYKLGEKGDEVFNNMGRHRKDFTPEQLDRYAAYCITDADLTYQLFKKLKVGFPVSELMVIDQTLRMYTQPVIQLDTEVLAQHLEKVKADKRKLIEDLALKGLGEEKVKKALMSNQIFAKLLTTVGVEPPMKTSLRTGKETYAFAKTDKEFTALLDHPDLRIQNLVAARLGTKSTIEETRTENLMRVAERGALPIMLNYYGAHTGRFSGGDKLNLQNLPRNGKIRSALTAPIGEILVACDSSQIEARMVAYIAGQYDLVQAFKEGRDVYSEFASEVYGKTVTKADKIERFVGKTCILGLGYGMGHVKFRNTLALGQGGISVDIDENEAQRIVRLYRQKNHKIVSLWNKCGHALTTMVAGGSGNITALLPYDSNGIILPSGLRVKYNALRQTPDGFEYIADARTYKKLIKARVTTGEEITIDWTRIYGGKVTENVVQALARIVVAEQMASIGQSYHVAFQVHDEIIISCLEGEKTHAQELVERRMSTPPSWARDLPVACESGVGYNYGDAK